MIRNKEAFINYLKNKFGDEVTDYLLDQNKLELKEGEFVNDRGETNKEKVKEHFSAHFGDEFARQSSGENPSFNGWAFDFPGWIGELTFKNNEPAKEIMVIGLEPHIENSDYQVTYGLRKKNSIEFEGKLDTNLKALFPHNDFYKQFYITDMCFFAPKGNANLIKKVKPKWSEVRQEAAKKFLSDEIEFIAPKIIISSGLDVAHFVENEILKIKLEAKVIKWLPQTKPPDWEFCLEIGNLKNLPFITVYEWKYGKVVHLGVPHLASGRTQLFWTKENKEKLKVRIETILAELK